MKKVRVKFSDILKGIVLFVTYLVTATLGLRIDAVSDFATLIWLPTGISLAAVLLFGYRLWPAIAAGAYLANLSTGAPPLVALGISIGNTLEAVVAAYLLKRYIASKISLDRLRDVAGLVIIAALFCTTISATIGVTSLLLGGKIISQAYGTTWLAWWIGDMISNLVIAPLILVLSNVRKATLTYQKSYEIFLVAFFLIVATWIVFSNPLGIKVENPPISYLIFPPLIWIGVRFGPREMVIAIFLLVTLATWSTIQGMGPFARSSVSESLIYLQSFMTVTSITFLILTALVSERNRYEKIKDELLAILSHELKTPITSIKGFTQILSRKFKREKEREAVRYLGRMDAQLNKLTNMVNNLLDSSRVEDQKLQLQKSRFSLLYLVRQTV